MEDTADDLVIIKSDDEKGEEADEEVGLVGENNKIDRKIIIHFYYSLCFCSFSVLLFDPRAVDQVRKFTSLSRKVGYRCD